MTLMHHGRRFHISFCASDLREPGQNTASLYEIELNRLMGDWDDSEAREGDDDDEEGEASNSSRRESESSDRMQHRSSSSNARSPVPHPCVGGCQRDPLEAWIIRYLQQTMCDYASSSSKPRPRSLHDAINAPTLFFTFKLDEGVPQPMRVPNDSSMLQKLTETVLHVPPAIQDLRIRSARAQQIPVVDTLPGLHKYDIVSFLGQRCFFKQFQHDIPERLYFREIQMLFQLAQSGLSGKIRVPTLHGLVKGEQDGLLRGVLLTFIDKESTLWDKYEAPTGLRRKWFQQISHSLKIVHTAGVVWGDVTAANVLIDKHQNAWLIDFGGGNSPGWIVDALAETELGDLQGLSRLKEFLRIR